MQEEINKVAAMRPDLSGVIPEYLAANIAMRLLPGKKPIAEETVLNTLEGIPFLYGRYFKGVKRPKGLRKQANKQCFRNATVLAMRNPELTYYEGYGLNMIPCPHAWCVDKEGKVVDPTWKHPEKCEYLGVPFSTKNLTEWMLRNEFYGVLGNMWFGKVLPKEIVEAVKCSQSL